MTRCLDSSGMSTADDMSVVPFPAFVGPALYRSRTMTPQQRRLADRISEVLQSDARIEAAWLAGSLGRNEGDAFSDVDIIVLCPDGLANEIAATPGLLDFAKPVLVNALFGGR